MMFKSHYLERNDFVLVEASLKSVSVGLVGHLSTFVKVHATKHLMNDDPVNFARSY